jgi:tRNA (guanine37-N1)-methyltransferase
MLDIELLSLFPSYIDSPLKESILKRAIQKRLLKVTSFDIRSYSLEARNKVDERPFGGGPGMVMMPEAVSSAIRDKKRPQSKVIYLSPQGVPFTSHIAKQLAQEEHLLLLAGHYEGIDQRVLDEEVDLELSIGDFVLTNGCLAALVLIDAIARFVPGVLGHEDAANQDSFEDGLLDCPHYTKPLIFHDAEVPPVLRCGDHSKIALWRKQQQVQKTYLVRPDLLAQVEPLSSQSAVTLFSSDISVLRQWYKKLTKIEECASLLGFSCCFDSFPLRFLPAEMPTSSVLTFLLNEENFLHLQLKIRKSVPESLCFQSEKKLVLCDPEDRLLIFIRK